MIVLQECPPEQFEAAGRILARHPAFAKSRKRIRAYAPIPLMALDADGEGYRHVGWRFLLQIGRRRMSADFSVADDAMPALVTLMSSQATERWLAPIAEVESAAAGQDDTPRRLALGGEAPHAFTTILLGADGGAMTKFAP